MIKWLLSVDPGTHVLGVALWRDGVLVTARAIHKERGRYTEPLQKFLEFLHVPDWDLAIELPQVYTHGKGDPNDLIKLATVVGEVEALCLEGKIKRYLPREWKGQVPKPKTLREPYIIAERAIKKLSSAERAEIVLPRQWKIGLDVWDAVGIGLAHLQKTGGRKNAEARVCT